MSEPTDPVPQRIGDAERDRAAEYLRDHMAAGRLDQQEFDERLNTALTARTSDELTPLFSDLPDPKPGAELVGPTTPDIQAPVVASPERSADRFRFAMTVVMALAWPAAIIACFATNWGNWWLLMIPIFLSIGLRRFGIGEDQHHRHRDRDRRRLDRGEES